MVALLLGFLLLGLSAAGIVIQKTLFSLPLRELKRRAERHDPVAERLFQAAAYGASLRALLWIFVVASAAAGFALLSRELAPLASFVLLLVTLGVAFVWLPMSRVSTVAVRLSSSVSPLLRSVTGFLYPMLHRITSLFGKRLEHRRHTGLFERGDLLELIEAQRTQHDNRLTPEELEIVSRALTFNDHTVGSALIPRAQVPTVLAGETVGPILIDELHRAGQEFVLVQDKKDGQVIGTLEVGRLGLKSEGTIRDHMDGTVYYVHENDTLGEALHAFFVTNHPMFIVVNSFEEFVGILTVEDILRQLLGHLPGEEFDQYSDPAAVAARHPRKKVV